MTLQKDFYLRDAREVARDLLGRELVCRRDEGTASGVIVETEAYLGTADRASHAFGGKPTRRTAILFEEGARAYIYLIYGMYWCLNLTTAERGRPECVLIRALEPRSGIDLMAARRNLDPRKPHLLADGPGKLCRALGIDGSLNGADLTADALFVRGDGIMNPDIVSVPRIGVDYAGSDLLQPWRYYLRGNRCVSRQ